MASKAENNLPSNHYATLLSETMNKLAIQELGDDTFTLASGATYRFSVTCCLCHSTFWLNAINENHICNPNRLMPTKSPKSKQEILAEKLTEKLKSIAPQFTEFGIELSIPYSEIRPIAANNPNDCKRSLQQVITLWLEINQSKDDMTLLSDLIKVLKSENIGQNRLATDLTWPNTD
ncbi:MAG: hypothetical protein HAW66_01910 [Shewanella sp.]|nr:hypothetical protein [Shewanella sp.]